MSTNSTISWTSATWNPVSGCTRVGRDCDECYAVKQSFRLEKMGQHRKYGGLTVLNQKGERHFNGVVRTSETDLTIPLGWKRPRQIFVNSMSDLFHRDVSFEFVDKVFAVMALCPQHVFQILTKRPERMAEYFAQLDVKWPFPNVWLGSSAGYQQAAEERLPHMESLASTGWNIFVSFEPLLEQVVIPNRCYYDDEIPQSCWINGAVIGCESGPRRRPIKDDVIRNLVANCRASGVKVFVKQMEVEGKVTEDISKFPEDLRIREFFLNAPAVQAVAP